MIAVLLAYLVSAVGFPLPAISGDASVGPCGCSTEERSLHQCCCCHADGTPSCCAPKPRSCCSTHQSQSGSSNIRWVSAAAAQKCRGMSSEWVSLGAVLPPPPAPVIAPIDMQHRIAL